MHRARNALAKVVCLASLITTAPTPAPAGTPCLEAAFFDLGNTLVENPGNGIFELRSGAAETITELQGLGVRLGIITNVPAGWDLDDLRAILAQPEFLDEFEVVILSSQAPAPKPNPAIYTFAHQALAEPRPPITSTAFVGETLSEIGNSVTNPTQGARAVGMIGIHLSDLPPNPIADYTIPSDSLHHVTLIVEETCSPAGAEEWSSERGGPRLLEPWPNPSANEVRLRFVAPGAPSAELGIFDAQGRRVATFLDRRAVGEFVWNGSGSDGIPIASGVYFARLQVGDRFDQVKLLRLDRR